MKLKPVREVVEEIDDIQKKYWNEHTVTPQDEDITKAITQDRQHTQEVLMGRVRELKKTKEDTTIPTDHKNYQVALLGIRRHNDAIDQALQIIEETFKSE